MGNNIKQRIPAQCKAGMSRFIVLISKATGATVSLLFFFQSSLRTTPCVCFSDYRDEEIRMSDATLECLERSFNIWVEMRKDFITLLEKKKKRQNPEVARDWERDTAPSSDSTMADLVYISATAAGHIQTWPLLFPVAGPPNVMSGVRWYPFLLKRKIQMVERKNLGEQLQRDHIKKQRCSGVENVWLRGRLEVNCFYRL